jgi:phenolic acid decarboxylase
MIIKTTKTIYFFEWHEQTMTNVSLVLNPNMKQENPKQKHKMCKIYVQTKFQYENMKTPKHNYGAKSYPKLMLNKQNVT